MDQEATDQALPSLEKQVKTALSDGKILFTIRAV